MFLDLEKSTRGFHGVCAESNFDALSRLSKTPAPYTVNARCGSWGFCTDLGDAFHSKHIRPVLIVRLIGQIGVFLLANREEDADFHETLE